MSNLGKIIELDSETRKLYTGYDFKYFLDAHIEVHSYTANQIETLNQSYQKEIARLKIDIRKNKRQSLYFLDGNIRKCHSGGILPMLFNLDESRGSGGFLDFVEIGKTWASFEIWKKYQKKKLFKETFWDSAIKIGAILGFVSTAMQIIQAV